MSVMTEKQHAGAFILGSPKGGDLSFDAIVVAQGASILDPGIVLGQITASGVANTGLFVPLNLAALDGSQLAAGILVDRCDSTVANAAAVALVRNAEVSSAALVWPPGATISQQAVALAQLASNFVIAR